MSREVILQGFDPTNGERTWSPDNPNKPLRDAFFDDLRQRSAAKAFFRDYEITPANMQVIGRIADALYPGLASFNVSQFEDLLATGIASGEFQKPAPEPEAPAPAAPAPTDKNGRELSSSQLRWREYREWSETATADQRKARCQTEAAYRKFVQEQMRAEMNSQPIDGAVEQPTIDRRKVSDKLARFAELFRNTPRASLRPINGLISAGDERWTISEFENLISEATAAGLL